MKVIEISFLCILATLLACNPKNKATQQKPNIILIYADDLGRGMLSTYGQKHLTTPNIDKLANEGMRFSNVYGCMFCAPARASLINGMHDCHKQIWKLTKAGIYKELGIGLTLNQIEEKIDDIHTKFYSEVNGDVFDGNDGMAGLKRSNWEGGVRVPLIWYWKGKIKLGTQSNQLVANYDLLNTIAELTGGENVEGKDSKSYAQTLLGNKSEEHLYTVYASQMGPGIVTKEGWKLRYYTRKNVFQLYNLRDDYREEKVLNSQFPEKVEKLKKLLLAECDGDWKNGGYPKFSIIE